MPVYAPPQVLDHKEPGAADAYGREGLDTQQFSLNRPVSRHGGLVGTGTAFQGPVRCSQSCDRGGPQTRCAQTVRAAYPPERLTGPKKYAAMVPANPPYRLTWYVPTT
jgi:hypothetical protein